MYEVAIHVIKSNNLQISIHSIVNNDRLSPYLTLKFLFMIILILTIGNGLAPPQITT